MIQKSQWKNSSKLIQNPGKSFFLKLTVDSVRDVNLEQNENGLMYACKAMVMTAMALNVNGLWQTAQLTPKLQRMVKGNKELLESVPNVVYIDRQYRIENVYSKLAVNVL